MSTIEILTLIVGGLGLLGGAVGVILAGLATVIAGLVAYVARMRDQELRDLAREMRTALSALAHLECRLVAIETVLRGRVQRPSQYEPEPEPIPSESPPRPGSPY